MNDFEHGFTSLFPKVQSGTATVKLLYNIVFGDILLWRRKLDFCVFLEYTVSRVNVYIFVKLMVYEV